MPADLPDGTPVARAKVADLREFVLGLDDDAAPVESIFVRFTGHGNVTDDRGKHLGHVSRGTVMKDPPAAALFRAPHVRITAQQYEKSPRKFLLPGTQS